VGSSVLAHIKPEARRTIYYPKVLLAYYSAVLRPVPSTQEGFVDELDRLFARQATDDPRNGV
jgi:hypothetical protein